VCSEARVAAQSAICTAPVLPSIEERRDWIVMEATLEEDYRRLTTPRAAAIAGILFALLYGTSLVLIRLSVPPDLAAGSGWLGRNGGRVALALNIAPFAGIAFLWFIGVIRDRVGNLEDRFFGSIFLGSGLLFLALSFASAAVAGGLVIAHTIEPDVIVQNGVYTYGRAVMYVFSNTYAVRMAGVFMISFATIALRTGVMGRVWVIVTYAVALILLLSIGHTLWVTLVFPAWVLAISVLFLISEKRS
jgi:hypothetical protein